MDINVYLKQVSDSKAPDLHLKVGRVPIVRLTDGQLYEMQNAEVLTLESMDAVIKQVLGEKKYAIYKEKQEVDGSYAADGVGRFRVNAFTEIDGPAIAFRSIPEVIPTLSGMGYPAIIQEFTKKSKGLVVVTGPTGSGKSTTLAAMVNEINSTKRAHILTIEDPIEFIHKSNQSLISQREVGMHTESFVNAIKSALREDPNVILIGEMRDLETIAAAITLAETGHLVLATLHTQDAAQTVDRMIDVFPPTQQQQIRAQLSTTLLGIVAQTLIPKKDGNGRACAMEILVKNDAITNCIKEATTHQIYSMMQIGRADGMQTLDMSLAQLVKDGIISEDAAKAKAHDPDLVISLAQQ